MDPKFNYTFDTALKSKYVFDKFKEAVLKQSKEDTEFSFCAFGDEKEFVLTKLLKEDKTACHSGTSRKGVVYDKEEFGLWKEEESNYIITAHVHPRKKSIAIPSPNDLEGHMKDFFLGNQLIIGENNTFYRLNLIDLIAQSNNGENIKLFAMQFAQKAMTSNLEYNSKRLCKLMFEIGRAHV